jgi:hypothetical protein
MKSDCLFNAAICFSMAMIIFFAGMAIGRSSGLASEDQALSAQRAQSVRDLSKYPLGHPRFFLSNDGLEATCVR